MSKSVRIRDHLYAEIERLAKSERRSLIAQLEVLLERALRIESSGAVSSERAPLATEVAGSSPAPRPNTPDHFKPDFKGGKR